jgi:hypothetical protein
MSSIENKRNTLPQWSRSSIHLLSPKASSTSPRLGLELEIGEMAEVISKEHLSTSERSAKALPKNMVWISLSLVGMIS